MTAHFAHLSLLLACLLLTGCNPSRIKYERYQTADPAIGIELDRISGWLSSESRGSNSHFAQVVFSEAPRRDKKLKAAVIVTVKDMARARLDFTDLQDAVNDLQLKRRQMPDGKLLKQTQRMVMGRTAAELEFIYRAPDRVHGFFAGLIPARERAVLFIKDEKLYKIRYVNYDLDFGDFNAAFDRILESMRFQTT